MSTHLKKPKVFPLDRTKEKELHLQEDHNINIYPEKDTITVEPTAKHIQYETTGKVFVYRNPTKKDAPV